MAAKTYVKKNTKDVTAAISEVAEIKEETSEEAKAEATKSSEKVIEKKVVKKFNNEDEIPCICLKGNKVVYYSTKTETRYEWSGFGDVCYVLYSDLLKLASSKSEYLYEPCIGIQDDDVLEDPRFSKLKKIYENLVAVDNPEDFFDLKVDEFRAKLLTAPDGFKDLIATTATKMVKEGTFESLPKLRIVDEVLGTGLHEFI